MPDMDTETLTPADEEVMGRLQGGDEAALAVLMGRWELPVKRFLFRILGNTAEAEDLAQEVFVRVFMKRQTYRPGRRFSSWLFAIAANQAKNRLRWWKRRPVLSLGAWMEAGNDIPDEGAPPANSVLERKDDRRAEAVQKAVSELPLDERTAIVLFEYEGRSMAEIAQIAACTAKAVENRLYRARRKLKLALGVPDA